MATQNLRPPTLAVSPEEYRFLLEAITPKPTVVRNCIRAFAVGGSICGLGQIIANLFRLAGVPGQLSLTAATVFMIFLGALFTGLGVYDNLGKFAGAGSIIPVTGFANSMVSPALEFKREGFILGVGARLFTVAGPVLVYGISASILVGLVYYLVRYGF